MPKKKGYRKKRQISAAGACFFGIKKGLEKEQISVTGAKIFWAKKKVSKNYEAPQAKKNGRKNRPKRRLGLHLRISALPES